MLSPHGLERLRGVARVDRRTKNLIKRLRSGDIAVIDHADLDALAAQGLVNAGVSAVINTQPFISGKYPNRGPGVLATAGIPMYQLPDQGTTRELKDGSWLVIDESHLLYLDEEAIASLIIWDDFKIAEATIAARANLGSELERFARNTLQYLDSEKDLLLDPTGVPPAGNLKIAGRHAMIVVRGEGYKEDLGLLRSYIADMKPLLIAVDGGADALLELGHKPDIILGDMDSVTDEALCCGARIIVHAYARRNGEAPGLARVQRLGLNAETFAVPGTSEDAALLFAYEHNADLIVALGTHSNLEDFLDKGRAGMASTFLVRLKVGNRLVDARGVYKLYQPKPPITGVLAIVVSALFPIALLVTESPLWRNMAVTARIWCQLHMPWLNHHK
jgi:uncharacterized membrane-anchored protein